MASRKARAKSRGSSRPKSTRNTPVARRDPVPSNAHTPVTSGPRDLTEEQKIVADITDYGFKRVRMPSLPLREHRAPRPKFPADPAFAQKIMDLMQNKIFFLREYFMPEAKALILHQMDKKRTKGEQAMLDTAADPRNPLPITRLAQDCLLKILYYIVIFKMEDRQIARGEVLESFESNRQKNLYNRSCIWATLRSEIADQLPGDKRVREERAEVVLDGALKTKEDAGEEVDAAAEEEAIQMVGEYITRECGDNAIYEAGYETGEEADGEGAGDLIERLDQHPSRNPVIEISDYESSEYDD